MTEPAADRLPPRGQRRRMAAEIQNALHTLLGLFLNGYGMPRFRYLTYPYLSKYSASLRETVQHLGLLLRSADGSTEYLDNAQGATKLYLETVTPGAEEMALLLAASYRALDELIREINREAPVAPRHIEIGKGYDSWASEEADPFAVKVVGNIARDAEPMYPADISGLFLHGSLATHDYIEDYSDVDMVVLITRGCVLDPRRLIRLRGHVATWQRSIFSFDPFQHHGIYTITEMDLAFYPPHYLPAEIFAYSVSLARHPSTQAFVQRGDSSESLALAISAARHIVTVADVIGARPRNFYELKLYVESILLLPTYYLQACRKAYVYKKFSYRLVRSEFSPDGWKAIDVATEFRQRKGYIRLLPRSLRLALSTLPSPRANLLVHHGLMGRIPHAFRDRQRELYRTAAVLSREVANRLGSNL